jgi:trehalose 6-phosphate phosphatase
MLLDALRAQPSRAAIFTDVDGTLAPIAERPEEAEVPARAAELLRRLAARYELVACISGRRATEARRMVGVDELAYAGNHGLELLLPGDDEPRPHPSLGEGDDDAARFLSGLDGEELERVGLRPEDKGPIQALHWRGADDEGSAEARARELAVEAGREPHWGRKVLELRPAVGVDKGIAVEALLESAPATAAAYAGDDRTDVDAFRRLRDLRDRGELEAVVCVAVVSPEGPPELAKNSDLEVEGPEGWLELLDSLAV